MSSEWIRTTIGEQATLQRGFDITKASQRPGPVPVVSSAGVSSWHDTVMVRGPGVVLGRKGVVGSVHYIQEDFWPHDTSLWVKDFHGNHPLFVYYFFLARAKELSALDVGSANPTLNRNHVHPIEVSWPSHSEQIEISAVLGTLDRRITLLRETNATLEAIAQALFKSWFVDFDPVRAKMEGRAPEGMDKATAALFPDELEESELGLLPKGWETKKLVEITAAIFSGGTPDTRKAEYWNGNLPWFSSGETRERIVTNTEKFITLEAVENSSTRLAKFGDVLIASAGQGHTRGQTSFCTLDTYINQSVVAVRANPERCNSVWIFYNLSRRYEEMRNISDSHSSRGSLTTKLLGAMPLVTPPVWLTHRFGEIAGALVDAQEKNLHTMATLACVRDTLLPRLISGQLRLPEAMEALEAA